MIRLSKRLEAVADLVTDGNRPADVGTDHGYLPIALCEGERIPSALALDVKSGPLERAASHIEAAGLEERIKVRLSDGLSGLEPSEADTIVISGMGGGLTARILEEGRDRLDGISELVLQPQSEVFKVRKWLLNNGFVITDEDVVYDEGKYYPMFRAVPGHSAGNECTDYPLPGAVPGRPAECDYTEAEFYFGRLCLHRHPRVLGEYIDFRLAVAEDIREKLCAGRGESAAARLKELEHETDVIMSVKEGLRRSDRGE